MTHQPIREPGREPGTSNGDDDVELELAAGDGGRLRAGVVTNGRI